MGVLIVLLVVLALSAAGSLVLWLRHRDAVRLDSGIRDFQREMQALARPSDNDPSREGRR